MAENGKGGASWPIVGWLHPPPADALLMLYDQPKRKIPFALTPTALSRLCALAASADLSRSETLERLLRSTPAHEGLVLCNENWNHD